jgi:hypothetical protein
VVQVPPPTLAARSVLGLLKAYKLLLFTALCRLVPVSSLMRRLLG